MPNFAFCENCGNRVPIGGGESAIRKYCGFCATPEGRKAQKDAQAKLEQERREQAAQSTA